MGRCQGVAGRLAGRCGPNRRAAVHQATAQPFRLLYHNRALPRAKRAALPPYDPVSLAGRGCTDAKKAPAARRRAADAQTVEKSIQSVSVGGQSPAYAPGLAARLASETRLRAQCADDGDTDREILRQIVCEELCSECAICRKILSKGFPKGEIDALGEAGLRPKSRA